MEDLWEVTKQEFSKKFANHITEKILEISTKDEAKIIYRLVKAKAKEATATEIQRYIVKLIKRVIDKLM